MRLIIALKRNSPTAKLCFYNNHKSKREAKLKIILIYNTGRVVGEVFSYLLISVKIVFINMHFKFINRLLILIIKLERVQCP